jgi:outer membrane lipoprotein-sorting protein
MMKLLLATAAAALFVAGCGSHDQPPAATQAPAKLPANMKFGYQPPTTKQ